LDAGPGGGWMAASAELAGDGIDVDLRTFGTETDPGQAGLDFLKEARDDHALDGPDMIDEPLGIVRQRAGAQVIAFLQPEISGALVVSEMEFVIDMAQQVDASQRIGFVNFLGNPG